MSLRIDEQVEPVVREAFAGAVVGDPGRFDRAFDAVAARGAAFAQHGALLAATVDAAALFILHGEQMPGDEQLRYLALQFEEAQAWAGIPPGVALTFLTALASGTPVVDVLPLERVAEMAFVMGGWLLSAFLPEGGEWTDFLDHILDSLEAMPPTDGAG